MDAAYAHLVRHRVRHVSTAPQTLPAWNPDAGGIKAFCFQDPKAHVLEIIWFPPGKGDPCWQQPADKLFLGVDHAAIVVHDTERSLAFYRDALGLRVAGGAENHGVEQEHLNQVFGARLRITALRAAGGLPARPRARAGGLCETATRRRQPVHFLRISLAPICSNGAAGVGSGPRRNRSYPSNIMNMTSNTYGLMAPSYRPSRGLLLVSWALRLPAALILLQTLFFKFTGAEESVYIFTTVGQEPWGRYGSGVVELIASVLLFVPGFTAIGALLALGTMSGAIFFHLTKLGIAVHGDGGVLFALAIVVWLCSGGLLWIHRRALPVIGAKLP